MVSMRRPDAPSGIASPLRTWRPLSLRKPLSRFPRYALLLRAFDTSEVNFTIRVTTHLQNWNITAGHWLKYYVYLRLDSPASKPKDSSATVTNLVSALWHGFYPGTIRLISFQDSPDLCIFWMFWVFSFLVLQVISFTLALPQWCCRWVAPFVRSCESVSLAWAAWPRRSTTSWASSSSSFSWVTVCQWCVIFFFLQFWLIDLGMACFYGLTWPKCSNYLFSMNFAGHIFLVVVYIIVMLIPPKKHVHVHVHATETPTVTNGKKND